VTSLGMYIRGTMVRFLVGLIGQRS